MPAAVPPQFVLFSLLHWTMLSGIVAAACGWVAWARTHPSRARRRHAEEMVAYANLALWIVIRLYLLTPEQFRWSVWIPLGMCDIVTLLVSLKLLRPQSRWLSIALYFGGVGLCTNALITPDLKEGPLEFEFWAFWLRHAAILVVAIYDVAVLGFRPDWSDWRRACVAGLGYVAIAAMTVTSFDRTAAWLGPRRWRRLHLTAGWFIWGVVLASYLPRTILASPAYAPFVVVLLAVLALRVLPAGAREYAAAPSR